MENTILFIPNKLSPSAFLVIELFWNFFNTNCNIYDYYCVPINSTLPKQV